MFKFKRLSFITRLILGLIFVISALTKGLDIFAVSAKISDYAEIFGIAVFPVILGIGSIVLVGMELIIGLLLIKGIYSRQLFIVIVSLLTFFIILTLYAAVSGRLEDCGCFGSVFKTSPWLSFIKNIILMAMAIMTYSQTFYKSQYKCSEVIFCFGSVLIMCVCSAFSQPLKESSNFGVGKQIYINTNAITSIDVDYISTKVTDLSNFGIIRHIDDRSLSEMLQIFENSDLKPVILTSIIPKGIDFDAYKHVAFGVVDNIVLNNLLSTEYGIFVLDDKSSIIKKWQKDYLNLQSYKHSRDDNISVGRMIYMSVWIMILIQAIYFLIESIMRGSRKTHQRVGNNK